MKLFAGTDKRLPSVSAGHTFYLEELGVKAGDSVSYYARATDNDGVNGGRRPRSSDLHFVASVRVDLTRTSADLVDPGRRGRRRWRRTGQPGGRRLSEQQRQIISATFNVPQRDQAQARWSSEKSTQKATVPGGPVAAEAAGTGGRSC